MAMDVREQNIALACASGDWRTAAVCAESVLLERPADVALLATYAQVLKNLYRLDEAETVTQKALLLAPGHAGLLVHLASIWVRQGRHAEAEMLSRRGLNGPHPEPVALNLAAALIGLGRYAEVEALVQPFLQRQPELNELRINLGLALRRLRDPRARGYLEDAYRTAPQDSTLAYNLALERLQCGDLPGGFELAEHRWRSASFAEIKQGLPQDWESARWRGEALSGLTLRVCSEQGMGDTLQFCRYLPLLAPLAARVQFECPSALQALMHASFSSTVEVLSAGQSLPAEAFRLLPLMSAPLRLGSTLDTIPAQVPYLKVPQERLARWIPRLRALSGPKIGLCWAGGTRFKEDTRRSLAPSWLVALAAQFPHIRWISLQKEGSRWPSTPSTIALIDWMPEVNDFADTAAMVMGMDLVITVDTSIAHLAGALGKQVWLLNRFEGEWRWLRERTNSPWYPSLRIFTQPHPGDWGGVMEMVASTLAKTYRLSTQGCLLSNHGLFYVTQSTRIAQPGRSAEFSPPGAQALKTEQIPSDDLYTSPLFWDIVHIRQLYGNDRVVQFPIDRVPLTEFPPRLLPYAVAGDVCAQLRFHLSRRGRMPLQRPLRLALFSGTGTMLGDTLIGVTAFNAVVPRIKEVFPALEIHACLAWNARLGVENILRHCPVIDQVNIQAVTLREFCQFDAYWDFSALLLLPGYDTMPLVDFYIQNFGIDPASVAGSEKTPTLTLDATLDATAHKMLATAPTSLPPLLIQAQASNPLRSMPEVALVRLLETLCNQGHWQPVVLNALPAAVPAHLSQRVLDVSAWSNQSIDHCFALIAAMSAVVTVDTLAVHAASALGVPGVAVFTSIEPRLRVQYAPSLSGILIPGARGLPGWGHHKTGDDWPTWEPAYLTAWEKLDWKPILEDLGQRALKEILEFGCSPRE